MINRWLVIVSGPQMNEELRKFPDEQMSFVDAVEDVWFTVTLKDYRN